MLVLPFFIISYISYIEMNQYKIDDNYKIVETAYGEPSQVFRGTLNQSFNLEGKFISKNYIFVDIKNSDNTLIKSFFSINDEVNEGDCLALVGDNNIYSPCNGIVVEFNLNNQSPYIKLLNLENLLFECYYDGYISLNEDESYYSTNNEKLSIIPV